ncbi:hypothetical protein [Xanthomonas arboricola]|uniref:hypothetical protein n=1 Tax=Xanthomonas arboricola TaxID=56448 RepID=UPI0016988F1F|nr:hypothetical protein [Xanthomonas arboricola]NJB93491.1 phage terminase small subunit [Xanthomonas arboricola]
MLVKHSLTETQAHGYIAMQFNYVVSKNAPAVQLYKSLGSRLSELYGRHFGTSNLDW